MQQLLLQDFVRMPIFFSRMPVEFGMERFGFLQNQGEPAELDSRIATLRRGNFSGQPVIKTTPFQVMASAIKP